MTRYFLVFTRHQDTGETNVFNVTSDKSTPAQIAEKARGQMENRHCEVTVVQVSAPAFGYWKLPEYVPSRMIIQGEFGSDTQTLDRMLTT